MSATTEIPLAAVSSAFDRLRDNYTPGELAEACRAWLTVFEHTARPDVEVETVDSEADGRAFETFVRGLLAAVEPLEG